MGFYGSLGWGDKFPLYGKQKQCVMVVVVVIFKVGSDIGLFKLCR